MPSFASSDQHRPPLGRTEPGQPRLRRAAALLTLALAACGGGDTGTDPGPPTPQEDTATSDAGGDVEAPADSVTPPDAAAPDLSEEDSAPAGDAQEPPDATPSCDGPTLGAGCPCEDDAACTSGFCAVGVDGRRCLATCDGAADCPASTCVPTGGSGEGLCLSPADLLCAPCGRDEDCRAAGGDATCLAFPGEGSFCATSCEADGDCPEGFGCLGSLCIPDAGTCACTDVAMSLGAETTCSRANVFGTCEGRRTCGPGGLTPCDAPLAERERCDGLDEDCSGVPDDVPDLCDDRNPCTRDRCDGAAGCVNEPIAGACDDGDACTRDDSCQAGSCVGTPACGCDSDADCTRPPEGQDAACVTGRCGADGLCTYVDKAGSCDDGDACTTGDACKSGACIGLARSCDDRNPCTADTCDGSGTCVNAPRSGPCEDGDACTTGDRCESGACVAAPVDCSHLDDACHVGVCDGQGGCVAQQVPCTVTGLRLHVPGAAFSRRGLGAGAWFIGSGGHGGPVGRSSNGTHRIHFGFHPGTQP